MFNQRPDTYKTAAQRRSNGGRKMNAVNEISVVSQTQQRELRTIRDTARDVCCVYLLFALACFFAILGAWGAKSLYDFDESDLIP